MVDGKDFFNNARARLSYDKFNALLGARARRGPLVASEPLRAPAAHIQRYNRRERTKDETLEALSLLLEGKNRDLYEQFVAMLSQ